MYFRPLFHFLRIVWDSNPPLQQFLPFASLRGLQTQQVCYIIRGTDEMTMSHCESQEDNKLVTAILQILQIPTRNVTALCY